eukprot:TRINITY_DN1445_c0_g1_i2.p1 TRINITY_DN1445_c0_g1~~TRINITY_DN1445_c0_g1_i2.p1  ORF type:complete len:360 (+),score=47.89 TRINITY_DN1445_c0_g1_i2:96-1175(+)
MAQAMAMAAMSTVGCTSASQPSLSSGLVDGCSSATSPVKPISCLRIAPSISSEWGAVRGLGPVTTPQQTLLLTSSRRKCIRRGLSCEAGYGGERATWTAEESSITAGENAELREDAKEEGVCGGVSTSTSTISPSLANEFGAGSLHLLPKPLLSAVAATAGSFFVASDAMAAGGQFGILEGRSLALIHPVLMATLFGVSLYAGYLGWQWRRVRTIQEEINGLKAQLPPKSDDAPPSPLQAQIEQLTEVRKQLVKGGFKDKHFNIGSLLLGLGVALSIEGGANTYLRTGRLFPGPHLYAGAGITVLWALAAALVPAMQKGNNTARNAHILLNGINVLLFASQVPTGIEIVYKVFEFTKWP